MSWRLKNVCWVTVKTTLHLDTFFNKINFKIKLTLFQFEKTVLTSNKYTLDPKTIVNKMYAVTISIHKEEFRLRFEIGLHFLL